MAEPDIKLILFDGDGVVQQSSADLPAALAKLVDHEGAGFAAAVFAAEAPCLEGKGDLEAAIGAVVERWGGALSVRDVLDCLNRVGPIDEVVAMISSVRSQGVRCGIASNQQADRARFMSEHLGYSDLFDCEFYSYSLRARKPDAAFFEAVAARVDEKPGDVLFIDDKAANCTAAEFVGFRSTQYDLKDGPEALRATLETHGLVFVR